MCEFETSMFTYQGLDHTFIEAEGVSTPTEWQSAGHVAEIVINDIASWIIDQRPPPSTR